MNLRASATLFLLLYLLLLSLYVSLLYLLLPKIIISNQGYV